MMAAGAITSDIIDMIEYGRMNLAEKMNYWKEAHKPLDHAYADILGCRLLLQKKIKIF